ncbi:MAG: MBOAT family protein, partial [Patescibacteria group bacterium]|nr:MBOAT family protein [Patescibacteria group bacterium]
MLFNSLSFLIFFAAVFLLYFAVIPDRFRWLFLLVASCIFYMAYIPQFILILFFLIAVDYFMGIEIAKAEGSARKKFLIVSIIANLGTLFFFKYFNFFNENAAAIAKLIHWNYSPLLLQIALPLGLSFHVFQSLSYVIEVYKGRQQAERHFGIYALYVMFFPQLVAGPIERPQHMLHQFHEQHDFSAVRVRRGLEIMLWGFFKKLVIADWGGQIVDHVFSNIPGTNSWTVVIAVFLFTYQLYCDFSGYSDIAVGLALVFGYHLTWNFNRPFASRSIAELWRRWHISLSSWLRDYLYTPLAFAWRKAGTWGIYASLLVTFAL